MKLKIHSNKSAENQIITTTAKTFGELKSDLVNAGVATDNRMFVMRSGSGSNIHKLKLDFDNTPLLDVENTGGDYDAILYVYAAKVSSGSVNSTKETIIEKIEELKAETVKAFDALIGKVNELTDEELEDYENTAAEIGGAV